MIPEQFEDNCCEDNEDIVDVVEEDDKLSKSEDESKVSSGPAICSMKTKLQSMVPAQPLQY